MKENDEILIVGCGFAGAVSALSLHKVNVKFRLFEASSAPHDIGGSITIFPNGMRVLKEFGLNAKVEKAGVEINDVFFQDKQGQHLVNRVIGSRKIYNEPTITIKRTVLNSILLSELKKLGVEVEYNKKVKDCEKTQAGMYLRFEDGTSANGSIVIGADGIGSTIRKYVLDDDFTPRYSELLYFGGFVKDQKLINELNIDHHKQYVSIGASSFFAYGYVENPENKESDLLWYTYLNQKSRKSKAELNKISNEELLGRVKESVDGWHSPIEKLVTSSTEYCRASISDVVEVDRWFKDGAVIIGDAAHSMNPISGQGACTAMEDAYMLSLLLEKYAFDPYHTFSTLERIRKPRVSKIAKRARWSSKRTTYEMNSFFEKIRNKVFVLITKLMPVKLANKTFEYDVKKELNI